MNPVLIPQRDFLKKALLGSAIGWAASAWIGKPLSAAQNTDVTSALVHPMKEGALTHAPECSRIPGTTYRIRGRVHHYLAGDGSLEEFISDFVTRLIRLQAEDGYLGS